MAKKTSRKTSKTRQRPAPRRAGRTRPKMSSSLKKKRPATKKAAAKASPKRGGTALMSVAPSLTVNDAQASVAWYCDVLGFKVVERWEQDGQFQGAQVELDDVVFYLNQDDWKLGRDRVKGQGTRIFITTGPDIDGYASAIKARGGVLAGEPANEWGMRAFAMNDPDGYKLTFMTKLPK